MVNPFQDPNNWRAVFHGEDPPNKHLTHGNIVTLGGTGQILLEYIGPNGRDEYIPVLFSPDGIKLSEFKNPLSPVLDEIKNMREVLEADLVIAYNKNEASFRVLKSRRTHETLIENL